VEATISLMCRAAIAGEDLECVRRTSVAFTKAVEYVCSAGLAAGTSGNSRLHHLCYRTIRDDFALTANLAIRAIARAAARLKGEEAEPMSVDYDGRICSIALDASSMSLATLCGRIQIPLTVYGGTRDDLARTRLVRATVWLDGEELVMNLVVIPQERACVAARTEAAELE
jgi:putative transposase